MRKYLKKLKQKRRKAKHVEFLHKILVELNNEIVQEALNSNIAENKAFLLKKYNRRLKLLLY